MELNTYASFLLDGEKHFIGENTDKINGISVQVNPVFYGENAVEWTLKIRNGTDKNSGRITSFYGLDIEIPCRADDTVEINSIRGDDCSRNSFIKTKKTLDAGETDVLESITGRPSDGEAFPFFDVTAGGSVFVFGLGWSGTWKREIIRTENSVIVRACQTGCDFYLYPGEEARSVRVLMYKGTGSRDKCCYEFREIMRNHIYPKNVKMPLSAQTFDRYYDGNVGNFRSEKTQLLIEKNCTKVKNIDTFWLDAAWFRDAFPHGVGNYGFEPGFPEGLKNLSEAVHRDGMRFMVWFEPERVDVGSDTFKLYGSDKKFLLERQEPSSNRMLNLGYRPAYDYLYKTISGFIRDYGIDIFRVDHNFDTAPYWANNDEDGRRGMTQMRSIEGFYAMWDGLLGEFPGLMIDNCSSGGRRLDLETLSRSVSCWRSDTGCRRDTEDRKNSTYAQNMAVGLSQYIPYHQTVSWEPEAYYVRSGMGYAIACAFDLMNDDFDSAKADRCLDEVRALAHYRDGRMVEITPQSDKTDIWFAYQLQCDDCACAFAFRRDDCKENDYLFIPQEIDENKNYTVVITDENYNKTEAVTGGMELKNGITLSCCKPCSSFVVEWKAL